MAPRRSSDLIAIALVLLIFGALGADARASRLVGHVYMQPNETQNRIIHFGRNADGRLELLEEPVAHQGREISLPYTRPGALGVGKPITSILHMNPLPIWLGTGTDSTVKLTAEIADWWLPLGFLPRLMPMLRPWVAEGFRRAGGGKGDKDLETQPRAEVIMTDDVKGALAKQKPRVARYVGGMRPRDKNFHKELMVRRGFGDAAQRIQELLLAKRKDEAVAAVRDEFCDEMSLVGPVARIRERYRPWADSGITGLTITTDQPEAMELIAKLANG